MSDYSYIIDRFEDLKYSTAVDQLDSTPVSNWLSSPAIINSISDVISRLLDVRGLQGKYPQLTGQVVSQGDTAHFKTQVSLLLEELECPYVSLYPSSVEMLEDEDGVGLCLDFLTSELQYELLRRYDVFNPVSGEEVPQSSFTVSEGGYGGGDQQTVGVSIQAADKEKEKEKQDVLELDTTRPSLASYYLVALSSIHTLLYSLDVHFHVLRDSEHGTQTALPANHYAFSLPASRQLSVVSSKLEQYIQTMAQNNPCLLARFNSSTPSNRLFPEDALTLDETRRGILSELSQLLYQDYLARRQVVLQKMTVMTQTFLFSIKYSYIKRAQAAAGAGSDAKTAGNNKKTNAVIPLSADGVGELTVTDPEYLETVSRIKAHFSDVLAQITYTFPASVLDCSYLTPFQPLLLTNTNLRSLSRSRHKSRLMASHPKLHLLARMPDRGGRIDATTAHVERER